MTDDWLKRNVLQGLRECTEKFQREMEAKLLGSPWKPIMYRATEIRPLFGWAAPKPTVSRLTAAIRQINDWEPEPVFQPDRRPPVIYDPPTIDDFIEMRRVLDEHEIPGPYSVRLAPHLRLSPWERVQISRLGFEGVLRG